MQQCELGAALSAAVGVDVDCRVPHCQKLRLSTALAKAALALRPSREAAAGFLFFSFFFFFVVDFVIH